MQLSDVILVYFVIGAVMVGGGAVDVGASGGQGPGIVGFFVEEDADGEIQPGQNATGNIDDAGGAISSIVNLAVGAIVLVWNLASSLFSFINWPILVLWQNNAPPMATLLLGGSFTAAFYMAVIGLLWRSS